MKTGTDWAGPAIQRLQTFIGETARPYAIYATATASALGLVVPMGATAYVLVKAASDGRAESLAALVASLGTYLGAAAPFLGVGYGFLAVIYGAKAAEVAIIRRGEIKAPAALEPSS